MGKRQGMPRAPTQAAARQHSERVLPHGRDATCRTHLSPCMAVAGNVLQGGRDATGSCGAERMLCPRPFITGGEMLSPGLSCTHTHTSRAHIITRVGAGSLCGHHIPHASMTLLPIMPCTPVMSCSTTAATSHSGPQSPPAPLRHCATPCSKGLITPQRHPRAVTW